MKPPRILTLIAVLPLAAALFSGCASYKMAPPASIIDACDAYPIDRPKVKSSIGSQEWKMGPYTAVDVDLGGTKTAGGGVGGFSKSSSSTGITFRVVSEAGEELSAKCEVADSSKGFGGFSSARRTMSCELTGGEVTGGIEIGADGNDEGEMGSITLGELAFDLRESKEKEGGGKAASATGYVFTRGGADVGAVDVVNSGVVYLGAELDDMSRTLLAAASVAMIFYAD